MIINDITIASSLDLYQLLEESIFLSGKIYDEQKEMFANGWGIMVDDEFAKKIKADDIADFILELVKARSEQIRNITPTPHATLYFWIDKLSLQLCFNILSGKNRKLPFRCNVNFVDSPYPILYDFIKMAYDNALYGNYLGEIEFIEKDDPRYGQEMEIDVTKRTLDVWKIALPFDE